MIEVYLLVTLAALGYMMNSVNQKKQTNNIVFKKPVPIHGRGPCHHSQGHQNAYNSREYDYVQQNVLDRSTFMYQKAKNPSRTGVITRTYPLEKDVVKSPLDDTIETKPAQKIRLMTGETVDAEHFTFNNMTPYFGGRVKQSISEGANKNILENYTGVSSADFKKKCEVASFYDNKREMANVNGMQNQTSFIQDRIVAPRVQNNITPVQQVRVGPGVNQGYGSAPTGGYQQLELQDIMMPKCVDQLRVATNPKVTYEGRIVDGLKGSTRADAPRVDKNRASTDYEQTPDHYLRTTGAYNKPSGKPEFNVKDTNRLTTSREYVGAAGTTSAKARVMDPGNARPVHRSQLGDLGIRNAYLGRQGTGTVDDYGKSRIQVYANERDITTTRVQQGNLTSLVKAIVAPIADVFKGTRKEELVDNPRHFGNMSIQIPNKPSTYDPNDIARTTIKETTVHEATLTNLKGYEKNTVHDPNDVARTTTKETTLRESVRANLKGNEKITVHDPNDIARTTTKETTLHESVRTNLKGHEKTTVHDPNDIARTTTKETTIHEATLANLNGHKKITTYDPNDIARTTIKETLIHDEIETGTITGPRQLFVYDPDEVAKTTIRQTLDNMDYDMNIANVARKGVAYDPDDIARRTMKETLTDKTREGNIERFEGMGDYKTTDYVAPNTNKQFLSDNDYYGGVAKTSGDGYKVANVEAPNTHKQFLSDIEYFGSAEAGSNKAQTSYDDMYNAHITAQKETVLIGREPTQTGDKQYVGGECISLSHRKQSCGDVSTRSTNNIDKVISATPESEDITFTRSKKMYDQDQRLDPSLLTAFQDNPYTHPLDSIA